MIANHPNGHAPVEPARVIIEYDPTTTAFRWTIQGAVPSAALVNTLELMKTQLIHQQMMELERARQRAMASAVLMPDGTPAPFRT